MLKSVQNQTNAFKNSIECRIFFFRHILRNNKVNGHIKCRLNTHQMLYWMQKLAVESHSMDEIFSESEHSHIVLYSCIYSISVVCMSMDLRQFDSIYSIHPLWLQCRKKATKTDRREFHTKTNSQNCLERKRVWAMLCCTILRVYAVFMVDKTTFCV